MKKKARFYKIPCYFNTDDNDLSGRNGFYDLLLDIAVQFDVFVQWFASLFGIDICFEIEVEKDI